MLNLGPSTCRSCDLAWSNTPFLENGLVGANLHTKIRHIQGPANLAHVLFFIQELESDYCWWTVCIWKCQFACCRSYCCCFLAQLQCFPTATLPATCLPLPSTFKSTVTRVVMVVVLIGFMAPLVVDLSCGHYLNRYSCDAGTHTQKNRQYNLTNNYNPKGCIQQYRCKEGMDHKLILALVGQGASNITYNLMT